MVPYPWSDLALMSRLHNSLCNLANASRYSAYWVRVHKVSNAWSCCRSLIDGRRQLLNWRSSQPVGRCVSQSNLNLLVGLRGLSKHKFVLFIERKADISVVQQEVGNRATLTVSIFRCQWMWSWSNLWIYWLYQYTRKLLLYLSLSGWKIWW